MKNITACNNLNSIVSKSLILLLTTVYLNINDGFALNTFKHGYIEVTPVEANHIINTYQNLIILDVRNFADYEKEHILGAISIPISELSSKLHTLDNNSTIIVYGSNNECTEVCKLLWKNGYKSLFSLAIGNIKLANTKLILQKNKDTNQTSGRLKLKNSKTPNTNISFTSSNYCNSNGGDRDYEYIHSISTSILSEGVMSITVDIYIANPDGCTYGESCPSYEESPEYVNAWIDWNGNNVFDAEERVLNAALTGYSGMNFKGTMSTSTVVNIPSDAKHLTWIRVNLGWGFDPNDPCEELWGWGDVKDKEIVILNNPPVIEDILISGIGVPDPNFPLTMDFSVKDLESVKFEAKIIESEGFEITEVNWSGKEITLRKGNPSEYVAGRGTHGLNNVNCNIVYKHKESGTIGKHTMSKDFKLFFHKEGHDRGNKESPNWFKYWNKDEAVPDMKSVKYDASESAYGTMSSSGVLTLGSRAADQHYSKPLVFKTAFGNESFGGPSVTGIDCCAEIIGHENYHRWVNDQWEQGGLFFGATDSDNTNINRNDQLPDFYEKETSRTDTSKTDTYNLEEEKEEVYAKYGDNEYMAMRAGNNKRGFPSRDWAYPGKQTGNIAAKSNSIFLKSYTSSEASSAIFTGNYTDMGIDENSDGSFDILQIGSEVNVSAGGTFWVTVKLNNKDSNLITSAAKSFTLESGIHNLILNLDGVDISDEGDDGPYFVTFVIVNEFGDKLDSQFNAHTTANYKANDFKVKDAYFTDQYSDLGKDIDGDSKFDSLLIKMEVIINVAHSYTIEGALYDRDSNLIEITTKNVFLSKGNHEVSLAFDGKIISGKRINGPYYLRYLGITKESLLDFRNDAYSIEGYNYSEFQSSVAMFNGQYDFQGLDTNEDGVYNFLRASIGIDTDTVGQYKILGSLFDQQNNQIVENEVLVSLLNGSNSITLDFKGESINSFGIDGPFILKNLTLIDENGIILDLISVADSTSFFSYSKFQEPIQQLVTLMGVFEDYKTDIDTNCIYDYLTVKSEIALADSGYVIAKAKLEDANGDEICWTENIVFLRSDTIQHILLNFDGESIHKHGVNGSYSIKNFYIYHTGDPTIPDYIVDAHTTKSYNFYEFDTIPGTQIERFETICKGDSFLMGDSILTVPGQYTLGLVDVNGCDSIVALTLNIDSVEKPFLMIDEDTLTCNMVGEYSWYLNNELLPNATAQSYIVETSGKYQIAVTNGNGCYSPLSDSLFVVKTSLESLEITMNIVVYPNPTNGRFWIDGLNIQKETLIQVFDINGRKISNKRVKSSQVEIDITGCVQGVYSLVVSEGNKRADYKIVKR